ncbi:MAG: 30S ribosomal protein S6 [Armatimonadota bacterium]
MATRSYETLYIVKPELKDSEIQKIADKFKKVVEDKGGKVNSAEKWEKRKLAYEIAGQKEGNYVIMLFDAEGDVPAELNRLMRISDDVMRHITILKEA